MFREILFNPETSGLYMGNPLSPVLTNLLMRKVVKYLYNVVNSINEDVSNEEAISFTVYADDITFSSKTYTGEGYFTIKFLTNLVNDILEKNNLHTIHLNKHKTTRMSHNRRLITGLRINHENEVTVPRYKYEKIRQVLHRLEKTKDPNTITLELDSLQSRLSFYRYVDTSGKVDRLIKRYADVIKEFNIKVGGQPQGTEDEVMEYLNQLEGAIRRWLGI